MICSVGHRSSVMEWRLIVRYPVSWFHGFSTKSAPAKSPLTLWSPTKILSFKLAKFQFLIQNLKITMTIMHHAIHYMMLTCCGNHFAIYTFIKSLCCRLSPNVMWYQSYVNKTGEKMHHSCVVFSNRQSICIHISDLLCNSEISWGKKWTVCFACNWDENRDSCFLKGWMNSSSNRTHTWEESKNYGGSTLSC